MLERLKRLAFSTEFNSQTAGCRAARKCWFMMRIKERWSPWSCFILQSHDISDTLKMNSHFKDEFAPLPLECSHTLDRFADRGGFILALFPPDPYLIRSEFSVFFDAYALYYLSCTSSLQWVKIKAIILWLPLSFLSSTLWVQLIIRVRQTLAFSAADSDPAQRLLWKKERDCSSHVAVILLPESEINEKPPILIGKVLSDFYVDG